jgi:RimJ/RimL family protein N-acetyltransferase
VTDRAGPDIRLRPYGDGDLAQLQANNAPEMTRFTDHETDEKVLERHRRYIDGWQTGKASMFVIEMAGAPIGAGSLGYWPTEHDGHPTWEAGWGVLPEFQGRGIAVEALRLLLEHAREHGVTEVYAFPRVDHPASNAVCRKAGFSLNGEIEFEYPKGTWIASNEWVCVLH